MVFQTEHTGQSLLMIHQSKHVNFIPEQLKKNLQLLDKYIFGAGPSSFPVGPLACLSASFAHCGKLTLRRVLFAVVLFFSNESII